LRGGTDDAGGEKPAPFLGSLLRKKSLSEKGRVRPGVVIKETAHPNLVKENKHINHFEREDEIHLTGRVGWRTREEETSCNETRR